MKKFMKYARRKTSITSTTFDRGSVTSLGSRASVSVPSEQSSELGSVRSLANSATAAPSSLSVYHVDLKTKDKTFTKLHRAAWLGDLEKVKKQVKKDDVNGYDVMKRTPLHLACAHGNKEVVWFLLGCKGDLNLHDYEGYTPFLRAVQAHHTALVHFLLDRSANPNDATGHEDTALHIAAKLNANDVALILLQKGANVDAVNKDGGTPLHVAAETCLVEMAELLLRHGAHVNAVDNDDRSCLMLACRLGSPQLVGLFLEYGSNRKLRDKSGLTASEYAIISQENECLKLMGEEVGEDNLDEVLRVEEEVDWKVNDDFERSSSRLNSWNDESEKENGKELLPNLNLNKFLASLDDSDKDVSEINNTLGASAPPKPPRISSGVSDPEMKKPEINFELENEDLENVFEDDILPVEASIKTDELEIDLDLSIFSDLSGPLAKTDEIKDEPEPKQPTNDVVVEEAPKTKKKRPTPPPRYTKIKKSGAGDEISSSSSHWDSNNNSVDAELMSETEKNEDYSILATNGAENDEKNENNSILGPNRAENAEKNENNSILGPNRAENAEKNENNSILGPNRPENAEKNENNSILGPNRAENAEKNENNSILGPNGAEKAEKYEDNSTNGAKNVEKNDDNWILATNGVKNVEKNDEKSVLATKNVENSQISDWDATEKSPKSETDPKQRLFVKNSDSDRSKRSSGSARRAEIKDESFIPAFKNLTDSESDWSEVEPAKTTVRQTPEEEKIKPEATEFQADDGESSDWDDSLSHDDDAPGAGTKPEIKDTPQGTLGREDTLHGLEEIWERNPSVEIRTWNARTERANANSSSEENSARDSGGKSCPARENGGGKGNVASKKNLFEAKTCVDVAALESILKNQLAEQQRRLDRPSGNSYRYELQRRRHSVDVAANVTSYGALGARRKPERPKSAESAGVDGGDVYKARPAMAGVSSDEEKARPEVGKKRKSMLSLGKFPTLKRLTKRFARSEKEEEVRRSSGGEDEGVVEEDFAQEVLERLEIRRKSNASLYEVGEKSEMRKTPSLEVVSESLSFSSSEDELVDQLIKMGESPREKTAEIIVAEPAASQDFVRDLRVQLEREKGERQVLAERFQSVVAEKHELETEYERIRKDYCLSREQNAILEAKIKTNTWELQQSENKWKECDEKLKKMLKSVTAKEETLLDESSRRQQTEMGNQTLQNELTLVRETLSALRNECKQLQKEFLDQSAPSSPARGVRKQLDEANELCQQVMGENQDLKLQLNGQKMAANGLKKQMEQLQCTLDSEREKMQLEVVSARERQKVEEEALKESTLGYMVEVNSLQSENNGLRRRLEESAQRVVGLEAEVACNGEAVAEYRGELAALRRAFDESQRNFNSNCEEEAKIRKQLEVELEVVCKENEELKQNVRNSNISNAKTTEVSRTQPTHQTTNDMEQLRNQISLLHDEMSSMKRQFHNPPPGPYSPVHSQTSPAKPTKTTPTKKHAKLSNGATKINNSVASLSGTSEDEQQVYREFEERVSGLSGRLRDKEEELRVSENKVRSLEVALVAAQDIIDKVNEEKMELMEARTVDGKMGEDVEKMQETLKQLECETKELRIQSEEARMHSHKLQDELLRVRLDYKRSEERLMDETNKKLEILKELETNQNDKRELVEEIEVLKEEREELIRRFDDGMEEQKRLWQVEARGRAELALRLLDSEHKTRIGSPGGDTKNVLLKKDEELERERNRCAAMQHELGAMKRRLESVDLSQEISSQIADLEHQVLELKCYISHEQEAHQRDRNRLQKAKESLHCVPDLRKRIAQLEHVRDELRDELIRFQSHVRENYVERDEMARFAADCEARANHEYRAKIVQMKARFEGNGKPEHEKVNNELRGSKNETMEELNRVKDALGESEMAVEMLRDQLAHVQEMYTAEVNLRAKMTRLNKEKAMDVGNVPFVIRNNDNQMKHMTESNKRLKSRKSIEESTESESNVMIYKVRAALDKSIEKYLLNGKY